MALKKNRIILITGASRGVGKGVALGIARKGDTIIITGRSLVKGTSVSQFGLTLESSLESTAEALSKIGAHPVAYQLDQNNDEEVKRLVEMISSEYGRLDIIVHSSCQIHDDLVPTIMKLRKFQPGLPFFELLQQMCR